MRTTNSKWAEVRERSEHPEGLLSKPCPTCGYPYGSAWLYDPLPPDVIEWAKSGGKK